VAARGEKVTVLPGKKYTPEEIARIVWRRRFWIAVPFAIVAIGVFAVVRRLPNTYKSETVILVVPQRVPESYVRSTVTARIEDRLPSIQQQILSRSRLEGIVVDFNLYVELRRQVVMEDVIQRMRKDIDVKVEHGDSFRVTYMSDDPRTAQKVTERLARLFIDENLRDREVLAEGTNQFLDAQLESAKRRLLEHEKKLEDYKRRNAGQLPSEISQNQQVIQNAEAQSQVLAESVNRDRDRRLLLERQLADLESAEPWVAPLVTSSDPNDPANQPTAAQQLEAARGRLEALERRLKPEHPDVIALTHVIRDLEAAVARELKREPKKERSAEMPVPVSATQLARNRKMRDLRDEIQNLDAQLARKEAESGRLRGLISSTQAKIDASPTREAELVELTRDYATLQNSYSALAAKREDAMMSASLERRQIGEQFKVLDAAHLPEQPFSPNRARFDLIGAAIGLGLGLGLALLLEYLDTSMRSAADVLTALMLPVLAQVPYVETGEDRRRQRRVRLIWTVTAAATGVACLVALAWKLNGWRYV
jgi:polysaccharide chain length determinant protein (PEP-CTERM system associated)